MYSKQLKTILYEYANTHGVGLPLSAEECLNAMSEWLECVLPECIDANVICISDVDDTRVTLSGNGTPENHYVFTFYLAKGEKGDKGDTGISIDNVILKEL